MMLHTLFITFLSALRGIGWATEHIISRALCDHFYVFRMYFHILYGVTDHAGKCQRLIL